MLKFGFYNNDNIQVEMNSKDSLNFGDVSAIDRTHVSDFAASYSDAASYYTLLDETPKLSKSVILTDFGEVLGRREVLGVSF